MQEEGISQDVITPDEILISRQQKDEWHFSIPAIDTQPSMTDRKGRSFEMWKNKDLTQGLRLTVISLAGLIALALVACVPAVPIGNAAGKPTVETLPTMEISPAAPISAVQPGIETPMGGSAFSEEVHPILQAKCLMCHNATLKFGGWDATSYESIMTTGDSAPVILSGDVQNSLLAQLLQGADGNTMPPMVALPAEEIQAILDWIAAGANR